MRTPRRLLLSNPFLRPRLGRCGAAWLVAFLALLAALVAAPAALAQQRPDSLAAPPPSADTTAAAPADEATALPAQQPFPGHHPDGALWRAAAVPGWGQFYNRQYYKIPIVYLGLGGAVAAVFYTHDRYKLYQGAHEYKISEERVASGEIDENPFLEHEDEYLALLTQFGREQISARELRSQRENFRRNRDLSVVGLGVLYGLTMVDAYVSAHLLGFDVDEDLSADLRPRPEGVQIALRYTF